MKIAQDQEFYLTESLKQHPSAFIIFDKDLRIKWMNNSSKYIFTCDDEKDLKIRGVFSLGESKKLEEVKIASSFESNIEIQLRNITFFLRSRVHEVPLEDNSSFFLLEVITNSKESLEAMKGTIACIEHDRIDLAYQKQIDLKTGNLVGLEALLRMRDEDGNIIPNDKFIPLIEGESLFSLVVMASLEKLKEAFELKNEFDMKGVTTYLNVSAHTAMQDNFTNIFIDFVKALDLEPGELGLEITETAELADVKKAGESFQKLKDVGIPLAIDDFGAGYSSLSYLRDLPVDSVKLDKVFAQTISEKTTAELIKFVVSVCETLSLNMLGEGIETDDQKEKFIKIGCPNGQGYLMHRPEFIEDLKKSL
ncbi:EAL domain-containing protein [SAR86 cluster bacterium]|nr:EAL domain-containing protein [SAR86 cluster bacterium]